MISYPNQKIVRVELEPIGSNSEDNYFCTINLRALENALQILKGADNATAFKLWIYFSKNQDGYCFALSSKHAKEYLGICDSAYRRGIQILIDKGFLEDSGNHKDFTFIQYP